jgi:hypothetical protein
MRHIPGWVIGAAGVSAVVGAFYLGGHASASPSDLSAAMAPTAPVAAMAPDATATGDLAVTCEPGQRAVVRAAAVGGVAQVACVSDARPIAPTASPVAYATYEAPVTAAPAVVRVANTSGPYAQPTVITEPVEVYRPRARTVSSRTGEMAPPTRSVKKSVAIIAGSTAAGAVVGGLAKGKKGAVVGGLIGGGAATVWDQVTRRRNADIR